MTQAPGKGRKRSVRRTAGEGTHTCAACFLYKRDSKEAYCTCCLNLGGVIRGVPAAGQARTLSALARSELLCLGTEVVHLNALDESLCSDLDDCYCAGRGKLFIYPMSAYIVPALFVATLFVNGIARGAGKKANLPNVLWYTTTDGRDLLSRLKFGKKREEVSSISGLTRLNAEGERFGSGSRNKRLFVSAHAVLPKDQSWCPTVLIADGRQFDDGQLTELLASALRRWPGILIYVVTANPMTSLVAFFKDQSWESSDYAGALGDYKMKAVGCRNEFDSIALQLTNVDHGVERVIETVADQPSAAWSELRDVLPLAKRSVKLLATARLFIAAAKWLSGLPLRPSEFEAHRSVFMSSFDDWLQKIRQVSKQEGNTAQLIAGATTILREVYRDLERQNPKREALFDSI